MSETSSTPPAETPSAEMPSAETPSADATAPKAVTPGPASVSSPVPEAERVDPKRVAVLVVMVLASGALLLFGRRESAMAPPASTGSPTDAGRSYLERPPGEPLPENQGLVDFGFTREWGADLPETETAAPPGVYRQPTARDPRLEAGLGHGETGPTAAELKAERRRQILRQVGQAPMRASSEDERSVGPARSGPAGPFGSTELDSRFASVEARLDRELAALEGLQLGGLPGPAPLPPSASGPPGSLRSVSAEPRSRVVPPEAIPAGMGFRVRLLHDVDTERQTLMLGEVLDTVRSLDGAIRLRPGDRLLGRSENTLLAGERRLLWSWHEVHRYRPEGLVVTTVPALEVSDLRGASGVRGDLDRHLGARYGSAILLSLISAGFALGESADLDGTLDRRDVAVSTGAEELRTITTEILRRNLSIQPTLRLRRGAVMQVILHRDLRL